MKAFRNSKFHRRRTSIAPPSPLPSIIPFAPSSEDYRLDLPLRWIYDGGTMKKTKRAWDKSYTLQKIVTCDVTVKQITMLPPSVDEDDDTWQGTSEEILLYRYCCAHNSTAHSLALSFSCSHSPRPRTAPPYLYNNIMIICRRRREAGPVEAGTSNVHQ